MTQNAELMSMHKKQQLEKVSIRVPATMKKRLELMAKREKRSLNQQALVMLQQALDNDASVAA